ncbi:MAG: hypothetical protein QNJ12_13295 [Ilumatobacter sp.]|uniref:hypothetical protein n=1 Tax=Ilumatobacter sp. TaxID=1967498 RepID=UPI002621E30A|nr:hypothetical protein [Ilumatobacter sp.]MDJ0769771.1 hypothetical protein [Ilumatobacter sp.]
MTGPSHPAVIDVLMHRHGRTFAAEAGIRVERNVPSVLFQLLCLSLLVSARIRGEVALEAARALVAAGWGTPERMAAAAWAERVRVLDAAGYARYDESTSRYLGRTADLVVERCRGDLRRLRAEATGSIAALQSGLTGFPGIGRVGAAFFLREVQIAWEELVPFVDERARAGAVSLGLPSEPHELLAVAGATPFAVFVAALVRTDLARDGDDIIAVAARASSS